MKQSTFNLGQFIKDYVMYFVLIILIIVFSILCKSTGVNFMSLTNLSNIVYQNMYLVVIGVGITIIMLAGAMDLSTGYQVSTISVVMGLMAKSGVEFILIILTGLVLGVVLGAVNGAIYARLKVFPFVITLAVQYVLHGITYLLSDSKTLRDFDSGFKFLGQTKFKLTDSYSLPLALLILALLVLIGSFILNKTYFGRNIYALGSNPDAVALSGVSVAKMRVLVFAVAGIFVALGSFLNASRLGSVGSQTGVGAEFTVMAGAMLGGIKMGGGGGKMSNMVVGVLIIGVLNNGMNLLNVDQNWQYVAMGVVLLLAIVLDTLQTESAAKRAKMVAGQPPTATEQK